MSDQRSCVSCGALESGLKAKFCAECGAPLAQSKGAANVAPPVQESQVDASASKPVGDSRRWSRSDSWHDGFVNQVTEYRTRKGLEGKSSLDLIRSGDRTALSHFAHFFVDIDVGDLIRLTKGKDNVTVRLTQGPYPTSTVSREQWSLSEGLDASLFDEIFSAPEYFQIRFELVNAKAVDPKFNAVKVNPAQDNDKYKRRFRLPDKTTMEQDFALDLPEDGLHLLVGGPGTGKSVIALLRALRLARKDKRHSFLAFNKLLVHSSKSLDRNTQKSHVKVINTDTWIHWFRFTWRLLLECECPTLGAAYAIDWKAIRKQLDSTEKIGEPRETHLVVDEGQDMPLEFYEAVVDFGIENIFVVADFNQVLKTGINANYPDLCTSLLKKPHLKFNATADNQSEFSDQHVVQLAYNHRNSYPVARLSREFYSVAPQNLPPDLPPQSKTAEVPVLEIYDGSAAGFRKIANRIVLTAIGDPTKLIGVLCPNNEIRKLYEDEIREAANNSSDDSPRIVSYASDAGALPDFSIGGIILLNAQSCKGLEFDYVIIAEIDQFPYFPRIAAEQKMLFYVMVSRAITRVILIQNGANTCPISAILPMDPTILAR